MRSTIPKVLIWQYRQETYRARQNSHEKRNNIQGNIVWCNRRPTDKNTGHLTQSQNSSPENTNTQVHTCKPTPPTTSNWWLMKKRQKTGHRWRQRWKCEGDTHHKLNVVEAVRQQVVFILHETDVVQPLSHGLDGAAGAYQGVQREAFEKWVAIHPVAATVRLRELALPHHVPCKVTVKGTRHAQQATESARGNGRDRKNEK